MQLQQLLEGEQWVEVEVPASVQAIADRLLARCAALSQGGGGGGGSSSPSSSSAPAAVATRGEGVARDGQNASDKEAAGTPSSASAAAALSSSVAASAAQLHILGRRFPVVTSSLILLKLLDEYLLLQVGGRGYGLLQVQLLQVSYFR